MRLNSLEEIERWILSWGVHASVVAPAALRERQKTAAAVAGQWGVGLVRVDPRPSA